MFSSKGFGGFGSSKGFGGFGFEPEPVLPQSERSPIKSPPSGPLGRHAVARKLQAKEIEIENERMYNRIKNTKACVPKKAVAKRSISEDSSAPTRSCPGTARAYFTPRPLIQPSGSVLRRPQLPQISARSSSSDGATSSPSKTGGGTPRMGPLPHLKGPQDFCSAVVSMLQDVRTCQNPGGEKVVTSGGQVGDSPKAQEFQDQNLGMPCADQNPSKPSTPRVHQSSGASVALQQALQNAQIRLSERDEQIQNLQNKLQEAEMKNCGLVQLVDQKEEEARMKDNNIQNVEDQLSKLVASSTEMAHTKDCQIQELYAKHQNLVDQFQSAQKDIASKNQQICDLQENAEKSQKNAQVLRDELQCSHENLQAKVKSIETLMQQFQDLVTTKDQQLLDLQGQVRSKDEKIADLTQKFKSLQETASPCYDEVGQRQKDKEIQVLNQNWKHQSSEKDARTQDAETKDGEIRSHQEAKNLLTQVLSELSEAGALASGSSEANPEVAGTVGNCHSEADPELGAAMRSASGKGKRIEPDSQVAALANSDESAGRIAPGQNMAEHVQEAATPVPPPSRGGRAMSEVGHVAGIATVLGDENEDCDGDKEDIDFNEPAMVKDPIKTQTEKEQDDTPTQSDMEEDRYSDVFDEEDAFDEDESDEDSVEVFMP